MLERAFEEIGRAQRRFRDYLGRFEPAWKARLQMRARHLGIQLRFEPGIASIVDGDRELRVSSEFRGYVWEALNNFNWFFALVEPQHVDGRLVCDYSRPGAHVLRVSKVPFEFAGFPEDDAMNELYLDLAHLNHGGVVLDGGAYCGASAYCFAKAVGPAGKVLSFEPDPKNFSALTRNIARHQLTNVLAINEGLWSSTKTLSFAAHGNMGSTIVDDDGSPAADTTSIRVTSIADAVAKHRLDRLDFVKLDIEGAEVEVVSAGREVLERFRPRLVIETHYIDGKLSTQTLRDLFPTFGYKTQILLESPHSPFHLLYAWPQGSAR